MEDPEPPFVSQVVKREVCSRLEDVCNGSGGSITLAVVVEDDPDPVVCIGCCDGEDTGESEVDSRDSDLPTDPLRFSCSASDVMEGGLDNSSGSGWSRTPGTIIELEFLVPRVITPIVP